MSGFRSWRAYHEFEKTTKLLNRYIHDSSTEEFLSMVLATSKNREKKLLQRSVLYRAQIGYDIFVDKEGAEELIPLAIHRMKPLPDKAIEGRANPKGIPYLYLATDKETAMAEVRPWIGSLISVGQFKTIKDLTLIDCRTGQKGEAFYFREPTPRKRELAVWSDIGRAFSAPVSPSDQTAEYIPTQIIAELFKNNGADGIIYKSTLEKGFNIALFDLSTAEMVNCSLYEVEKITFAFREIANPYFVRKRKRVSALPKS